MAELKHGPLTAEMVPLLTAGKSVLLATVHNRVVTVIEAVGSSVSYREPDYAPDGCVIVGEALSYLTYLGEDIGDGWIAAPLGGWTENPVPGQRVECRDPDGKEWLPRPSENWTDVNRWPVFTAFRLTDKPKHEATDAMGMSEANAQNPLSGKSGEAYLVDALRPFAALAGKFGCWSVVEVCAPDPANPSPVIQPIPLSAFENAAASIERATTQPAEQSGPTCQTCGGKIEGWTCQGCGRQFSENEIGNLVAAEQSASSPVEGEEPNQLALDICEREIDGWDRLSAGKKTDIHAAVLSALTTRSVAVSSEAVARLVDPIAWKKFDCLKNGGYASHISREQTIAWSASLQPSVKAAEQILSLLNQARKPEGDEPVAWRWTESGTDTDGDPKVMKGEYGDYVVTLTLSRMDASVSARINYGGGKLGFRTFEDAKKFAVDTVTEQLTRRLALAKETVALYAHPAHEAGEVERLRRALEPFARAASKLDGLWDEQDWRWNDSVRSGVTVAHIRAALAALEDKAQGAQQ